MMKTTYLVVCILLLGHLGLAKAQLAGDEYQRRMEALNKRATTKPAAPKAESGKFFKWQAKSNAPAEVKEWVNSFDILRGTLIAEADATIAAVRDAGKKEEVKAKLRDPASIPVADLAMISGRVGYLRNPVTVAYVVDEHNWVGNLESQALWFSGMETSGLRNGASKMVDIPVRVAGIKKTSDVSSTQKSLYVVEPFEYREYVEQVEVSGPARLIADADNYVTLAQIFRTFPKELVPTDSGLTTLQEEEFRKWIDANVVGQQVILYVIVGDVTPATGKGFLLRGTGSDDPTDGVRLEYQVQAQFGQDQRGALIAIRPGQEHKLQGFVRQFTVVRPAARSAPDLIRVNIVLEDCKPVTSR
jgi:hypothetical protein